MCQQAILIAAVRDMHRKLAREITDWELNELHMHLAIESEKYLRRHEGRCLVCREKAA